MRLHGRDLHAPILSRCERAQCTNISHKGKLLPRILTVIDEQPNEVPTKEITLAEAEKTLEELVEAAPDAREPLNALLLFMGRFHDAKPNKLFRPGIEISYATLKKELGWFATHEATTLVKFHSDVQGADALLTYAKALLAGTGWIATGRSLPALRMARGVQGFGSQCWRCGPYGRYRLDRPHR